MMESLHSSPVPTNKKKSITRGESGVCTKLDETFGKSHDWHLWKGKIAFAVNENLVKNARKAAGE